MKQPDAGPKKVAPGSARSTEISSTVISVCVFGGGGRVGGVPIYSHIYFSNGKLLHLEGMAKIFAIVHFPPPPQLKDKYWICP